VKVVLCTEVTVFVTVVEEVTVVNTGFVTKYTAVKEAEAIAKAAPTIKTRAITNRRPYCFAPFVPDSVDIRITTYAT
jgi:hypothetical protein